MISKSPGPLQSCSKENTPNVVRSMSSHLNQEAEKRDKIYRMKKKIELIDENNHTAGGTDSEIVEKWQNKRKLRFSKTDHNCI